MGEGARPATEGTTLDRLLVAVARSIDEERLRKELGEWLGKAGKAEDVVDTQVVLNKIVLADLLDDTILGARPGDKPFPLRMLLGRLGESLENDTAFAFANGLNLYFRASMEDEDKARLGFEVSRLFYRFAEEVDLEEGLRPQASPLLADLLSSQLDKIRLESVDHERVFDSRRHEREASGDASSPKILRPGSFAAIVSANGMVRVKARVWT